MEQYTFNEIIERITNKLTDSDDDTVTFIYNQLFDTPITYVGDDLWEEEIHDDDEMIPEDDTYNDENEDDISVKPKKSKYDHFDSVDDFNDEDD